MLNTTISREVTFDILASLSPDQLQALRVECASLCQQADALLDLIECIENAGGDPDELEELRGVRA